MVDGADLSVTLKVGSIYHRARARGQRVISRREAVIGGAAFAASTAASPSQAASFAEADFARAVVIDGLGSINDPGYRPDAPRLSATVAADLRESGLTAVNWTVNGAGNYPQHWDNTIASIGSVNQWIAANNDRLLNGLTVNDIRRGKAEGKTAIVYGLQDTSLVGTELNRLGVLRGLGVRIVQLTYNLRNLSGDGALEPANAGISRLGRETIARIEAERMLVDFSHGGQRTIAEGLAATTRPPTISHTGCRALNDNPRNVGDAEMKACADRGGVVGIYWMPFLRADSRATSIDLIRHMDHARKVCGEDHVAIGTDGNVGKTVIDDAARARQRKFYEDRAAKGIAAPGEGADVFNIIPDWDDHLRFKHLADGLARAGWPSRQIEKALGANLLRLYSETFG